MPRPQRDLDPQGGPLVEFARDLRALRESVGTPKFTTMARRTGRSKTALAEAAGGRHLPRWETVEDFVRACDADPTPWRPRWTALRARVGAPPPLPEEEVAAPDEHGADERGPDDHPADARGVAAAGASAGEAAPAVTPAPAATADARPGTDRFVPPPRIPVPVPAPAPAARVGSRRRLVAAGAAAVVVGTGVLGFVVGRVSVPDPPVVPQSVEAILVQNKVALGADRLVEDRSPAYLSTEALAYCAQPSRSCKVPGTEMASGAAIVANCWTTGQRMWNYDLADPASQANPDRAESDLWYRASFPDGRTGYISEVYIARGDRGGRGLPRCTA